uniref:Sec20 C-terminal domain-containing protein n=1 Tax=Arcella intermedia TaxID=1963864 RepID=A0A6B2LNN8_9EUKA
MNNHKKELQLLRAQLTAANQIAKANKEATTRTQYQQVFGPLRQRKVQEGTEDENQGVEDSKRINENLKLVRNQVQALTSQSGAIYHQLESSSQTIAGVIDVHDDIKDQLNIAKKHTSSYKMIECTSGVVVILAFIFYLVVCTYIMIVRFPIPIVQIFEYIT